MNKWQMSGATLTWARGGGHATDNHKGFHFSIHPQGRSDAHREKQRRQRSRHGL